MVRADGETDWKDCELVSIHGRLLGWAALKKAELLGIAEAEGFEVFVTDYKNLPYQQNLTGRRMTIITLSLSTSLFSGPMFR